ncbi:DEAD/DEAH box helicase [Marinimicrococcus flavescens]|uniref:DEAD-box ATP-dependent RNA helicase RhpA n=1 Tax=Marinimicrococcus flavescens TaxID=3031815 RepID=A0AAP3V342_9PROT|nr:DEAD/DEAH box helicase [Marinimicrococcus flavescens]
MTSFSDLGLIEPLQRALAQDDYSQPTPIQAQAIPSLLEGRDLLGIAQTGTGKTAAFALPLLHRLAESRRRPAPRTVRLLVLAPTRELAVQIHDSFGRYGRHLRMSRATVMGGVGHAPQIRAIARGVDVLVATPGRLLDLMASGHVRFDALEAFVLDEADRMFDMGFLPALKRIVAALPAERQTLLFSATMPEAIKGLAQGLLRDPVQVSVAPVSATAERVDQKVMFVQKADKRPLLAALLETPEIEKAIVFTRTKHGADRLAEQLDRHGVPSDAIHGNRSQGQRQRALNGFRHGRLRILVATDIAARGVDVAGVTHVINYDLPNEPETYVHRIGRTARAGAEGVALSFCDNEEIGFLREIEKLIRQRVPIDAEHPFHAPHIAGAHRGEAGRRQGAGKGRPQHRGKRPGRPEYQDRQDRHDRQDRPSRPPRAA